MDLRNYLDKFCTAKEASRRSPQTITMYRYQVGRFIDWCVSLGYRDADLIGQTGAETIEEYLVYLEGEGLSAATLGIAYRNIRALYHWMFDRYDDEMEGKNPFKWLHHPTMPELLPKNISLNEVLVLLHSIKGPARKGDPIWVPHRDRLIIKTLFYTGMRASELISLSVEDVDLDRRLLRVVRWKVHKEEFIPIAKSMVQEFSDWLNIHRPKVEGDGLWPTRQTGTNQGLFLVRFGLNQMLRRRCVNAGLPQYRPHAFRHGCAINIIKRGGDISLVQKILGHRDITTSQIYLRYDMDTITGLYDKVFD